MNQERMVQIGTMPGGGGSETQIICIGESFPRLVARLLNRDNSFVLLFTRPNENFEP